MRNEIIIFCILSVPIIYFSRHVAFNTKSHGFYRFLGWECIAWLFANNVKYWFNDPLSWNQILSWIFLLYASYIVIAGVILLKNLGKADQVARLDNSLYNFEKTTELVDTGLYKLIRHPLYGSLIFLSWGVYLKNTTKIGLLLICILSTILFYITAKFDEKECIQYFGEKYRNYMNRSKMFIPFVF
jgi:protein-S-isoprenylcysteine O-methyltransferase Ste14